MDFSRQRSFAAGNLSMNIHSLREPFPYLRSGRRPIDQSYRNSCSLGVFFLPETADLNSSDRHQYSQFLEVPKEAFICLLLCYVDPSRTAVLEHEVPNKRRFDPSRIGTMRTRNPTKSQTLNRICGAYEYTALFFVS